MWVNINLLKYDYPTGFSSWPAKACMTLFCSSPFRILAVAVMGQFSDFTKNTYFGTLNSSADYDGSPCRIEGLFKPGGTTWFRHPVHFEASALIGGSSL